jgi:hypothetical protein
MSVGVRKSRKTNRNKGCGVCSPWKRQGNSVERRPHRDNVAIEAARIEVRSSDTYEVQS